MNSFSSLMHSITNHFPPLLVFGETLKKNVFYYFLEPFSFKVSLKILEYFLLFFLCYEILATNVTMASYAFFMPRKGNWDFGPHYVITLASTLNYLLTDILTFNRKILPNFSDFKSPYFCNGPILYLNVYIIHLVLTRIKLSLLY